MSRRRDIRQQHVNDAVTVKCSNRETLFSCYLVARVLKGMEEYAIIYYLRFLVE